MFLNIQIDLLILKTYDGQFTLTTKKIGALSSLRVAEAELDMLTECALRICDMYNSDFILLYIACS